MISILDWLEERLDMPQTPETATEEDRMELIQLYSSRLYGRDSTHESEEEQADWLLTVF